MSKRRWMKRTIATIEAESVEMPWARGARRARWKAAARARALAA